MRLALFTAYHKPSPAPLDAGPFYAFHLENRPETACPRLPVAAPTHIATRESYCEMRMHYYVWKNLLAGFDYVGFQHYRRLFAFPQASAAPESPLMRALTHHYLRSGSRSVAIPREAFLAYVAAWNGTEKSEALEQAIDGHDIVVPDKFHSAVPLSAQWAAHHDPAHWGVFVEEISRHPFFRPLVEADLLSLDWAYFLNMYIVRASLFDTLMNVAFDVLEAVERRVELPSDPYQRRLMGFLAERLFTYEVVSWQMWNPSLRIREAPLVVYQGGDV